MPQEARGPRAWCPLKPKTNPPPSCEAALNLKPEFNPPSVPPSPHPWRLSPLPPHPSHQMSRLFLPNKAAIGSGNNWQPFVGGVGCLLRPLLPVLRGSPISQWNCHWLHKHTVPSLIHSSRPGRVSERHLQDRAGKGPDVCRHLVLPSNCFWGHPLRCTHKCVLYRD